MAKYNNKIKQLNQVGGEVAGGGFITTGNLTGYVSNNTSNISGSTILRNMMQITQSGYNAITPAVNTLYIIVG